VATIPVYELRRVLQDVYDHKLKPERTLRRLIAGRTTTVEERPVEGPPPGEGGGVGGTRPEEATAPENERSRHE
jgi:hypothetical protein